jgi:hypothetical protein
VRSSGLWTVRSSGDCGLFSCGHFGFVESKSKHRQSHFVVDTTVASVERCILGGSRGCTEDTPHPYRSPLAPLPRSPPPTLPWAREAGAQRAEATARCFRGVVEDLLAALAVGGARAPRQRLRPRQAPAAALPRRGLRGGSRGDLRRWGQHLGTWHRTDAVLCERRPERGVGHKMRVRFEREKNGPLETFRSIKFYFSDSAECSIFKRQASVSSAHNTHCTP